MAYKGRGNSVATVASGTFNLGVSPATGDWVIVIFLSDNKADLSRQPIVPAGWSTLYPFATVGNGTMSFGAYAKKYAAPSDLVWSNTYVVGLNVSRALAFYGDSPAGLEHWDVGPLGIRELNATNVTAKAPTVWGQRAGQALLIAAERTAAAEDDSAITVNNGYTKVFTDMSFTSILTVGTKTMAAGSLGETTVTYPNSHTYNGVAFQILIPNAVTAPAPSGVPIKVREASGWVERITRPKVWTGTQWKEATLKVRNGSQWLTK